MLAKRLSLSSEMADLLADMVMRPRYSVRTQAAFVRSLKFGRGGFGDADRLPRFNILSLSRLHDMNPPVYVCAITLLDAGIEENPSEIRESTQFRTLIDRLGLQPSGLGKGDVKNSHRASLVLLEVFTYMVVLHRARREEEEAAAARGAAREEELLG